jgi:hypothetical protein
LPAEHDERGNVNNVIRVGDIAQIRPSPAHLHITVRVHLWFYFTSFQMRGNIVYLF